jgi:hypothetical protein
VKHWSNGQRGRADSAPSLFRRRLPRPSSSRDNNSRLAVERGQGRGCRRPATHSPSYRFQQSAWSPLAFGVLTGKYHGEGKTDGGRLATKGIDDFLPEQHRATAIISAVKSVSEQVGRSMAQVALACLRHQPVPVIPIIGARKVSQLQDNLASLDLELSAEQLKSLDAASRIELGFPQSLYPKEMVRGLRYGGTWDRLPL